MCLSVLVKNAYDNLHAITIVDWQDVYINDLLHSSKTF